MSKDKEKTSQGNSVWQSLNTKWRGSSKDDKLDSITPAITNAALELLQDKSKREQAKEGIKQFLEGKRGEQGLDDCVRWHILRKAVEIDYGKSTAVNPSEEVKAKVDLSNIIVEMKPYLGFERYEPEAANSLYSKHCQLPQIHKMSKDKNIPFHVAARCGNFGTIREMISNGRAFYDGEGEGDPFLHRVQQPDLVWSDDGTALELAITAGEGSVETLRELLKVDGLAIYKDQDGSYEIDECFDIALKNGLVQIVQEFLEHEELASVAVTRDAIIKAAKPQPSRKKEKQKSTELRKNRREITKSLVGAVKRPGILTEKVVETLIKGDFLEIFEQITKKNDDKKAENKKTDDVIEKDLVSKLLHLAVLYQKERFVALFAEHYAFSVKIEGALDGDGLVKEATETKNTHYPLWYNNHEWDRDKDCFIPWNGSHDEATETVRRNIRQIIVTKMIEVVDSDLSDIFHESKEPFGDLCFDISRFNSASFSVSDFVDSLTSQHRNQKLLTYEKTLRYVEFPPLDMGEADRDMYKGNSHFQRKHTEVFKILDWLSGEKGVETIIKLKVPDRLLNPHDAMQMAEKIEKFKVKKLEWRVLDLSMSIFSPEAKDNIDELHLYASGNRAVISHWLSEEGIRSFKMETCLLESSKILTDDIRREVSKLERLSKNPLTARCGKVEVIPWYPSPKPADLSQIASRIAPKLARLVTRLDSVVRDRRKNNTFKPTKVAILDNGILSISTVPYEATAMSTGVGGGSRQSGMATTLSSKNPTQNGTNDINSKHDGNTSAGGSDADQSEDNRNLWSRIEEGRSFVDEDSRLSPWLFASDPHGTQMANLICAIDPFCKLYVARVSEDQFGISAKSVKKAIEWARSKDVDVISMSFVIGEDDPSLSKEIERASDDGIIMVCSTHDEGTRFAEAYPAAYAAQKRSIIALAASDEYGKLLRPLDEKDYKYMICGQDVAAGVIPFLESEPTVTGSSASTALAAGLSSLILTWDRVANPNREYALGMKDGSRYEKVTHHLDLMQSTKDSKFVLLEKFVPTDMPRIGQAIPVSTQMERGPNINKILIDHFDMGKEDRPRHRQNIGRTRV